jgi:DNA polymerase-3 subunit epsilon
MKRIGFSVVDVETTGFSPQRGDRIVEIGVVRLNSELKIEKTFETLINPRRDVGPTSIHGITAEMVHQAPLFEDIAPSLLNFVDGTIVVAHNAPFDVRFLNSELGRSRYKDRILSQICTLELARRYVFELPSLKLPCLCEYFGINLRDAHCALADSEATAMLLAVLCKEFGALKSVDRTQAFHSNAINCTTPFPVCVTRGSFVTNATRNESPLGSLLKRLPTSRARHAGAACYSELLDRVLLDRIVTDEEASALLELAENIGLSRDEVIEVHLEYLRNLVRVALIDGVITDIENRDLRSVAKSLSIDPGQLDQLVAKEKADKTTSTPPNIVKDYIGKSVCFTGELQGRIDGKPITRELAHKLSIERGLLIRKGVTKDLDYLVEADPNTQSSKAQKARSYGVTTISECAYWQMIGLQVE